MLATASEGAGWGAEERAGAAGCFHVTAPGARRQLLSGAAALADSLAHLSRRLGQAQQRCRAAAAPAAERRRRDLLHLPPCER